MANVAVAYTVQLESISCYKCGVIFGCPPELLSNARKKGGSIEFWCPNGHGQSFIEGENDKLRRQLEAEKRATEFERNSRRELEKQLQAQRAATTRLKKRVANGLCPCCNRSFVKLAAHMKTQHPEFVTPAGLERES